MDPMLQTTNQPEKRPYTIKLFVVLIFLGVIAAVAYIFLFRNNPSDNPPPGGNTGTLPVPGNNTTGTSSGTSGSTTGAPEPPVEIPSGNTITIKTRSGNELVLDNFYKRAVEVKPYGDAAIIETDDYIIWYFLQDSAFLISIRGTKDPHLNRALAESEFTATLKITQEQACDLKVILAVSKEHLDLAGKDYGLSFCPWGKEF